MRVLVVEDEKGILDFLKISLEAECFAVDTTEDGIKGLAMARANNYDVIILDNMLPGKTGQEICQDLRKDGNIVPIIMLSVKADSMTKVDLLNAGADDYLTKPFSFYELLARIRALMRRPKKIESEMIQMGDLTLDIKKHKVTRSNREIHLTRKEFTLLEYLMRNPGVVMSRGMIMEHVWDVNADPFSNTVESHILNLRRKVDTGFEKNMIRTISGRGYKIDIN